MMEAEGANLQILFREGIYPALLSDMNYDGTSGHRQRQKGM